MRNAVKRVGSYTGMRSWNSYFGFGFLLYTFWLELLENMI
jgi:hypothetical protein